MTSSPPPSDHSTTDTSTVDIDVVDSPLLDHFLTFLTPRRRERFTDVLSQRTRKLTVVLENLSQSHNFSAVLRTCDCFGVQNVHLIDPRETFAVNSDVALGAEKWTTLSRYHGPAATADCVARLKADGYRVLVTSPHGQSTPVHDVPIDEPTALVLGTELEGISDEMESLADGRVHIPMVGFTESFNVSVAAAICLADLTRRLRTTTNDWALTEAEHQELLLEWCRRSITHADEIEARFLESQEPLGSGRTT